MCGHHYFQPDSLEIQAKKGTNHGLCRLIDNKKTSAVIHTCKYRLHGIRARNIIINDYVISKEFYPLSIDP